MKEPSDEQLFGRMRRGDRRAMAELYDRHEPALYRYALHMSGSRFVAEEVAHEVFMQLMAPGQHFDQSRGSLQPYLYGIARNLIRGMRRKPAESPLEDRAGSSDLLRDLISSETVSALYRSLQELPERYRDAIALCDLEERSYEEAARLMGCPIGTVRSRLHRARILLASKLKPVAAAEVAS